MFPCKKRVILAVHLFCCCFVGYLVRSSFSIQILSMRKTLTHKPNQTIIPDEDYGPRYDWGEDIQGLLLGAYFGGYCIGSLLAGWCAENFNTVQILTYTTTGESIIVLLIPLAAPLHWSLVFVSRLVCGVLGGMMLPACHTLVSKWAPPHEKGKFTSMLLGGGLGTFATWALLGFIIPLWGWRCSFFVVSLVTCCWAIVFYCTCHPSPREHPTITLEELQYIEDSLPGITHHEGIKVTPPIKQIVTNIHFICLMVLHFGNDWGLYFVLTMAPKFLKEGLNFDMSKSGILSGIPPASRLICGLLFGIIGDFMYSRKCCSLINMRRFFVLFSHIIPGIMVYLVTYCDTDTKYVAVALMTIGMASNGASVLTNNVNNQDLAPNFAGSLYGYSNAVGGTSGQISPVITGHILKNGNTIENWRKVFVIGMAVYFVSALVFIIGGSASIQPFNDYITEKKLGRMEQQLSSPPPVDVNVPENKPSKE